MADTEDPHVDIARLRWPVTLVTRVQTPDAGGTGIIETPAAAVTVHADIQPVGAITFWGAEQTDNPVTHRIFMRWHDYLDQTRAIYRTTSRPDGTSRTEVFRVRRIKEIGGRKRFALAECELEKVS